MAHGAGGKATAALIEGLLSRPSPTPALDALADAGTVDVDGVDARDDHRQLRRQAAALPRRLDRRARGQRHGQRPRDGRRAAAGADAGLILEEGLDADVLRAEVEAIAARPRAAGVRSSPATRRSSSAATPTRCTSARPASGIDDPRARLSPGALRPGDRILVSGRSATHGTAIMLARGEFELGADDRVRHAAAVAGGRRAARRRRARRCAACATRRAAASPRSSTSSRAPPAWRCSCARRRCRCTPVVAGAAELLGIDPMHVANEGVLVAVVAPEHADAALAALRGGAGRRAGGGDRRSEDGAPRHGAGGDGLWRQAGDGSARRRPAAADLLRGGGDGGNGVRTEPGRDRGDRGPRPVDHRRACRARATRSR